MPVTLVPPATKGEEEAFSILEQPGHRVLDPKIRKVRGILC